jgi:O-methyltransferase involved in polyketide biosynthesis
MYIPSTAVEDLFAFIIKASGPESSIVADYFDTAVVEGKSPLKEAIVLRQFVENEGSSLKFGIQAGKGEEFFKQRGFREVCCVSATTLKDKFFTNDSRNRTVSPMFNFVHAMK